MTSIFPKEDLMKLFKAESYLETNISELFLSKRYVYKIKKIVDLGFVDFTDPKTRKKIDKAEYEYNRLISPEVYLDLISISKKPNGRIFIGKENSNFEYVQKMTRLPSDGCLAVMLREERVSRKLVMKLAEEIVDCHFRLRKIGKSAPKYGRERSIKKNFIEVLDLIRGDFSEKILSKAEISLIEKKSLEVFEGCAPAFQERVRENAVQKIHGDLHSENVFVKNHIPYITDAILPIPSWQNGDCVNDVAALVMDFEAYEKNSLGNLLVKTYAKLRRDSSINKIILFYKLGWALTRLWVNLHGFKEGRDRARSKAIIYKKLIFRYLDI